MTWVTLPQKHHRYVIIHHWQCLCAVLFCLQYLTWEYWSFLQVMGHYVAHVCHCTVEWLLYFLPVNLISIELAGVESCCMTGTLFNVKRLLDCILYPLSSVYTSHDSATGLSDSPLASSLCHYKLDICYFLTVCWSIYIMVGVGDHIALDGILPKWQKHQRPQKLCCN